MFWYHLDIQNQNGCPKVATDAILRNKNSGISIFHENEMGRRAWANKVSFPPNSELSNLIELYLRAVLTIKFKMIAQNGIILTFKIQDGRQRHIESQEKVLSPEPNVPKKANEATFPIKFGNPYLMERFLLCSEIMTFKSEMATQFVCLFISPLTWDTQSETIQEASVLSWGPVASDAIFKYITVIFLEPDVSLRPKKCNFLLILALQIW